MFEGVNLWIIIGLTCLSVGLSCVSIWLHTQLKKITNKLHKSILENHDLEATFMNDFSFIWQFDLKVGKLTATSGAKELIGVELETMASAKEFWMSNVYQDDVFIAKEMFDSLYKGKEQYIELRYLIPEEEVIWLGVYGKPLFDEENKLRKFIGMAWNISESKQIHAQMYQRAHFDSLTKLPNHRKLKELFNEKIEVSNESKWSLFLLDVDRFKIINETRGREIGDEVLNQIADRLRKTFGEKALLSRESGDEFLLLIEESSRTAIQKIAKQLLSLVYQPFEVDKKWVYLTASVGISSFNDTAESFDELMYQAETSMYMAKEEGKNRYHLFEKEDECTLERRRKIELGLKEAIKNKELSIVYQPKIHFETGNMHCVESLVRWTHPELGIISPAEFIPIAEESGEIIEIGYWVMRQALHQVKEWRKQGKDLKVSVNVSPIQFQEPTFVSGICEILEKEGLEANHLILEITESVMQNIDLSIDITHTLHKYGIQIAIDDFGTGYSSLSVLNKLAIDYVKIDKAFIDEVPIKEKTSSLVRTMIQMGENLGFMIIAEGIETEEQAHFLKENNCEYGQGYLFSKPVKAKEIVKIVERNKK